MPTSTPLVDRVAKAVPLSVYRMLVRRKVVHFFYHSVSEEPPAHLRHLYACKSPMAFETDLLYLKSNFHPITYQQLADAVSKKQPLPRNAAMLSFDDGLAECYTTIRPLLIKHDIPAIFFIPAMVVDNQEMLYRHKVSLCIEKAGQLEPELQREKFTELGSRLGLAFPEMKSFVLWIKGLKDADRERLEAACQAVGVNIRDYLDKHCPYLTGDQMRQLKSDGFTLGAHGVRHVKFNLLGEADMEDELRKSCRMVGEISGEERVPFAFPFSASGVDREALRRIAGRSPEAGLLFNTKGFRAEAPLLFNRIWADVPRSGNETSSDLPLRLKDAYQDVLFQPFIRVIIQRLNIRIP